MHDKPAILLTGATGYLGSHLLPALLARGERLVCLQHRRPVLLQHPNLHTVPASFENVQSLDALFASGAKRVLHLAAVSRATSARLQAVNVQGTENLLAAAQRAGVRHFLYVSSQDAVHPVRTRYGDSKWAAEQRVMDSGLPWTILRPNLIYGDAGGAMQTLCNFARRWHVYPQPGNGKQRWRPLPLEQAVESLCQCIAEAPQGLVTLSGDTAVMQQTFLAARIREAGIRAWPVPLPLPVLHVARALSWPLPGLRETVDKLRLNASDRD